MKNPLRKRLLRELKDDFGKYVVIFLFMILLISLVSGFLIADNSVSKTYNEGFEKYQAEDGHLATDRELPEPLWKELEKQGDIRLYPLTYYEETLHGEDHDATIRIYHASHREVIDKVCLMKGSMPAAADEIILDRLFAENNKLAIGDVITLHGRNLTISGVAAFVDYSSLYEKNTDMMFDANGFSVAVMTDEGIAALDSPHITYNYAWKYNQAPGTDKEKHDTAETLMNKLADVVEAYDTEVVKEQLLSGHVDETAIVKPTDFLPAYENIAITFTGEDMSSDKAAILLFDYLITALLAFVVAVTTNNTIAREAGVIGTLRASGYSRGELVRHYMVLPMVVSVVAAVVGNVLGYTLFENVFVKVYFTNYSLATYESLFNAEAFLLTTVIPLIIMFVVNLFLLMKKLRLTPLQFLRHELSNRGKKKAFRLNTKLPILQRFRLRILFQNIPGYIVMFVGIFMAGAVVVFGLMFPDMLASYEDVVKDSMLCDYQYVLMKPVEVENSQAEKYSMTALEMQKKGFREDEISMIGLQKDSRYMTAELPAEGMLVSSALAAKYGVGVGDDMSLYDKYTEKTYELSVGAVFDYDSTLAVFMSLDTFNDMFDRASDEFTGYFSNEKLTEIDEDDVAAVITAEDKMKVATQLSGSMGEMFSLFQYFGVVLFILVMYILSKQIIEKNTMPIAMTKILGFKNSEIGGLYVVATSLVVVLSLLVSMPIVDLFLRWCINVYLYTLMSGYIPYLVSPMTYVEMFVIGMICYGLVSVIQMRRIGKIPKGEALKMTE